MLTSRWISGLPRCAAAIATSLIAYAPSTAHAQPVAITDTMFIERQGSLYLDPVGRRLFVTQAPFNDLGAGAIGTTTDPFRKFGQLEVDGRISSVSGMAFAPSLGRGWTANNDVSLTAFDLETLKPLNKVSVKKQVNELAYDSVSKQLFALSRDDLTIIDAATGTTKTTLALNARPTYLAVDGKGLLFVTLEDGGSSRLAIIDTRTNAETARHRLAGCTAPAHFDIDVAANRLMWVCSDGSVAVVDPAAGTIVSRLSVPARAQRLAFDPKNKRLAVMVRDGSLRFAERAADGSYTLGTAAMEFPKLQATTMRADPLTGKFYLGMNGTGGSNFRVLVLAAK